MACFIINKKPIYIDNSRYQHLLNFIDLDENTKNKDYLSDKEQSTVGKKMYDYLRKEFKTKRSSFLREWFYFYFEGKEAQENIYFILDDYCSIYGISKIRNINIQKTPSDKNKFLILHLGEFSIQHEVKPIKWIWRYTKKMKDRSIVVRFATDEVITVYGNLENIVIKTTSHYYFFSEQDIIISPEDIMFPPEYYLKFSR